ncbi:hypothetical protein QW060_08035 [Myroides ceti]|uniref:Uncharacterized protein n=1 Tax=Paenimyroides ceti TaxID=395087 RepID=A0ABT8CU49_9FLAO|nr:hypothetical protein [Paenimyroides ceti]MDN3707082.1 hypothetical protein [Paenimyroides ceti]
MKQTLFILITFMSVTAYSQTIPDTEFKISEINTYIEDINENEQFEVENINGTLKKNNKDIDYSISYFAFDATQLFSVIYQEYDEISTNKIFYYKKNKVVAAIVEIINNKDNKDRLEEQAIYFYDVDTLLNTAEINEKYPHDSLLNEGKNRLKEFLAH